MKELSENAHRVLCKRYLLPKDNASVCLHCGGQHEMPEDMFRRVSFGNEAFYNIMSNLDFLPNSPALFNAGSGQGTLSACFKFDVEDSMYSIMEVATKAAFVQKWGGGVGYCLSALRQKGAPIRSTHGKACGPVAVMDLYQSVADMITQGGKRHGAQMAILHCSHPDVLEFIHSKDGGTGLNTFNISVACTNDFMETAIRHPQSIEAKLLEEMAECAWRTGDPGIYFIDTAEAYNPTPHLGKLTGTNPCGEVPLLDNEPCNIGSINLVNFVTDDSFDYVRLGHVTRIAVRLMDTILDYNKYPNQVITDAATKTRKLGIGVMGWADALVMLKIPYDSTQALECANKVMKLIQEEAHYESHLLAGEQGSYPAITDGPSLRNATLTCIAPTGTIAVLANCSSGIEPHYALENDRVMGDGTVLKEMVSVADGFIPKTAHEIPWDWHIKHQGTFQKHTDLAVSKTINMPESATVENILAAFKYAWHWGCKGITVYRDKSRIMQVLSTEVKAVVPGLRRHMPSTRQSETHKFVVGGTEGYLTLGMFEDGSMGEMFVTASKQGATIDGLLNAIAIITSVAIQHGVPLELLAEKMIGSRFEPHGLTANKEIPTASSLLDYIFRYAMKEFGKGGLVGVDSGMLCPNCGAAVILQEGCLLCSAGCGWTRC